jgi:hypothetical protein
MHCTHGQSTMWTRMHKRNLHSAHTHRSDFQTHYACSSGALSVVPYSCLTLLLQPSVPLAWRDRSSKLHSIDLLDYETEREMLWQVPTQACTPNTTEMRTQVLKQSQRDLYLECDFATTDTLRSKVTMGCRALHFSGHGHPQVPTASKYARTLMRRAACLLPVVHAIHLCCTQALNFEDGRGGLQFVAAQTLR